MHTYRFGRKLTLPSTIAIKHQIRKLMFEDSLKKAAAEARAEAIRGQLREETRPLVQSGPRRRGGAAPRSLVSGRGGARDLSRFFGLRLA